MTYPSSPPEPLPPTGPRTEFAAGTALYTGEPHHRVNDWDDVAVTALEMYVTFHRPGTGFTACGQVSLADCLSPMPGAWYVRRYWFGRPCESCWPRSRDRWLWPVVNGRP